VLFKKYNFFCNVRPCIFACLSGFMFLKSFFKIISETGIQRIVLTFYYINKPHCNCKMKIVGPPRIARGPAAYETAEVLLLHGPMTCH